MYSPDQARVTRVDRVESQHHAVVPTLALPHEVLIGFDRPGLEVDSLPDRHGVTDFDVLQLRDDAVSTGNTGIVQQIVAVPPGALVADLHRARSARAAHES